MSRILVVGGGVAGLTSAMVLARDGHEVTVLERDPASPPDDASGAWEGWERRGVNQFKLLHFFQPGFRRLLEAELPGAVESLEAAGALRIHPFAHAPDEFTGGVRPGDDDFVALTARRPVAEAALAQAAARTPGLTVRRGVGVTGLLTTDPRPGAGTDPRPGAGAGPVHVRGVRTDTGEETTADLVVDAGGRRSALPRWLADAGTPPPVEEVEDSGFVYYGRHFRGTLPVALGPVLTAAGSISILSLPADNGTWGVGIITSAADHALRSLRETARWDAVLRTFPLLAHWVDGEPIEDDVQTITKIEDRHRSYVVDGAPVATGVVAVGDAWACTNPSVGRGATIGFMHAVALRDQLRETGPEDPARLVLGFDRRTMATVEPWYRGTLSFDRHRLAEIDAAIAGKPYETDDPTYAITQALQFGSSNDPDLLRAFLRIVSVLNTPEEVLAMPGVFDKVLAIGESWRDAEVLGPTREELLAIAG